MVKNVVEKTPYDIFNVNFFEKCDGQLSYAPHSMIFIFFFNVSLVLFGKFHITII